MQGVFAAAMTVMVDHPAVFPVALAGVRHRGLHRRWRHRVRTLRRHRHDDAGGAAHRPHLPLGRDRAGVRGCGHQALPAEPSPACRSRCWRPASPSPRSPSELDWESRHGISWLADKIEQWPTAKLLPYARNARTHSDDQVAQIAASIAEFGFTNPILAGSDGVIVAGHGRLAAAQKLGLAVVPVVVLDHLTPTQRRALVIADNRIAENAGWDDAMLRSNWKPCRTTTSIWR
jgi:hypothetical protein